MLGRALDIRVQAIVAPSEEVAEICVSADVLYGETKVSPGAVRATLQRATPDAQAFVRIQASVPIDEPVVTVLVRAGCTAPFTRRYVLLADPISEPSRPTATATVGGVPAVPRPSTTSQLPAVPAPIGGLLSEPTERAPNETVAAATGAAAPRATVQRPTRERATPAAKRANRVERKPVAAQPVQPIKPRLELDAIDLSLPNEPNLALKLSPSLLSEPASSQEARATAGRLWQAINTSPENTLRDATRLETLGAEVIALREAQASGQATLNELTSRLEQSQKWQWWVVVLGVLLALALLALLWMWRQQKTQPRFADDNGWWAQEKVLKVPVGGFVQPVSAVTVASPLDFDFTNAPAPSASKQRSVALGGSALLDNNNSKPALLVADRAGFAASQTALRAVATEELFDVQQQADFFISLGEDEQAIAVLRNHIAESQVPSALTYLDLLKIYHRQGREEEYERLRVNFNGLFNAGAPAFKQFSDEGRGLEFYERALGRIQALWPQPRVLDVIEQSIFREQGDLEDEVFDLEAYRELLLLYAMAKEMIERETVDSRFTQDFENTTAQALKATAKRRPAGSADRAFALNLLSMAPHPAVSPSPNLDVNLDDLSEFSAFEASLPDVDVSVEPTAQAVERNELPNKNSNLIDFELLDFTPPDGPKPPAELDDKKR